MVVGAQISCDAIFFCISEWIDPWVVQNFRYKPRQITSLEFDGCNPYHCDQYVYRVLLYFQFFLFSQLAQSSGSGLVTGHYNRQFSGIQAMLSLLQMRKQGNTIRKVVAVQNHCVFFEFLAVPSHHICNLFFTQICYLLLHVSDRKHPYNVFLDRQYNSS